MKLLRSRIHTLPFEATVQAFAQGRVTPLKTMNTRQSLTVKKRVSRSPGKNGEETGFRLSNRSQKTLRFLFGTELRLAVKDAHVNRVGEAGGIRAFMICDPFQRVQLSWRLSRPARLWYFPLEEGTGKDRVYRGVSLTYLWDVRLPPRGSWSVDYQMKIEHPHG